MRFTQYFLHMRQRPDRAKIRLEWIDETIKNPEYTEVQLDGRIRKWKKRSKKRASSFASSYFPMEKPFIMLSLIGVLKEKRNENQVFFGYGYGFG